MKEQDATPHGRYFRYVFGQSEAARDLVLNVMRQLEVGAGDYAFRSDSERTSHTGGTEGAMGATGFEADSVVSVTPHGESFVDEQLGEHRTDLLVTLQTASGRELALHLLFEHKSRKDPEVIFQLMRYHAVALNHLATEKRKQGGLPPPIISVVIYNGPGSWNVPTELREALDFGGDAEHPAAAIHRFRYLVFDVGLSMNENFVGGPVAKTALQAMYAIGNAETTALY